ncbi:hypothetical protein [Halobacillus sp. A5]|uniref:hypothetical protein n=1 Tax=Halobacillus sp. A5 TaxID=2880263 RepID=UPI0020A6C0EA|nr:hypothetical protein [Halobacillus sp. A5]MCP3027694.1 hypothetical protein [Halobacillus sp. A5]
MPTYKANDYLVKDGKVVSPGQEIEITEEQAAKLGDKVKDASTTTPHIKKETSSK